MRILSATLLLALLVPAARAQEKADPTAQIPKDSPVAFRIASFDRVDALVKEWLPILKTFGLGQQVAPLEQMPASAFLFMITGLNAEMVDRTKPIYVGLANEEEPVVVLHPAEGAAWDGKKELAQGQFAVVRGGAIVVAEGGLLDAEVRGTPTTFRVDGDAVVHVYLSDLIAASKEEIEGMATEAAMGIAAQGAIPEQARALILPVVTAAKDGVLSLEALDYGASWTDGRLETEGFVSIREGSGLRNLMKRVGDPGSTDLVAYLPKEAYMTMSVAMNADWPSKELKALLEQAGGTDVAKALMQLMSMGSAFEESRTGRAAISVNMLMMSASVMTLVELKPGTDPAKILDAMDLSKAGDALAKIGDHREERREAQGEDGRRDRARDRHPPHEHDLGRPRHGDDVRVDAGLLRDRQGPGPHGDVADRRGRPPGAARQGEQRPEGHGQPAHEGHGAARPARLQRRVHDQPRRAEADGDDVRDDGHAARGRAGDPGRPGRASAVHGHHLPGWKHPLARRLARDGVREDRPAGPRRCARRGAAAAARPRGRRRKVRLIHING